MRHGAMGRVVPCQIPCLHLLHHQVVGFLMLVFVLQKMRNKKSSGGVGDSKKSSGSKKKFKN
jgi:hypothetical protein